MKQVEWEKDVHTVEYRDKTWQDCHLSDLKNAGNQSSVLYSI